MALLYHEYVMFYIIKQRYVLCVKRDTSCLSVKSQTWLVLCSKPKTHYVFLGEQIMLYATIQDISCFDIEKHVLGYQTKVYDVLC